MSLVNEYKGVSYMSKYTCSICGYIYDEKVGIPDQGIAAGTKWDDVPSGWICPVCGATKDDFVKEEAETSNRQNQDSKVAYEEEIGDMTALEMSALFSNLSKGCEKQFKAEQADLFASLSDYYHKKNKYEDNNDINDINSFIEKDLSEGFSNANRIATERADRGALRALVWSEKVKK